MLSVECLVLNGVAPNVFGGMACIFRTDSTAFHSALSTQHSALY